MPQFDGALQRSTLSGMLVDINKPEGSQIRGVGIFASINGAQPNRNSLSTDNRVDGYISVIQDIDKIYVFHGNTNSDWTNPAYWTELGSVSGATPAITSNGVTPSLNAPITAEQIRDLINLGASDSVQFSAVVSSFSGDLTGDVDGTVSDISNHSLSSLNGNSDDITQGSTNLFMDTTERAKLSNITVSSAVDLGQIATNTSNISSEVTNRTNADLNLQNQITANASDIAANLVAITANDGDILSLQQGLASEIAARQSGDTANANAISINASSISTLQSTDSNLQSQITANDNDISALQGADVVLQQNITQNTNAIAANTNAISTNTNAIAANAAAISTNAGNISSNAGAISANAGAISTNAGNISANAASISILQTDLSNHTLATNNPHSTAISNLTDVSSINSSENDVLAKTSSGNFEFKNPFDLFMAAADLVSNVPTSGTTLGDLDGDGNVGVSDLLIFLSNFNNSIFELSSGVQNIVFTSLGVSPTSINDSTNTLTDQNYSTQTGISSLSKLEISSQTSDYSTSPMDWLINQTNDYIQYYTTDSTTFSSNYDWFDGSPVIQIAEPSKIEVTLNAEPQGEVLFCLYYHLERFYPTQQSTSSTGIISTYQTSSLNSQISINSDSSNPLSISGAFDTYNTEKPIAFRLYFYVGVSNEEEYDTFSCKITDLKLRIIQ